MRVFSELCVNISGGHSKYFENGTYMVGSSESKTVLPRLSDQPKAGYQIMKHRITWTTHDSSVCLLDEFIFLNAIQSASSRRPSLIAMRAAPWLSLRAGATRVVFGKVLSSKMKR